MSQATASYASTTKATIHFLGERLFEDKTPNNVATITLEFTQPVSLEGIWCYCQDHNSHYTEEFNTRSVMVGDVIECENGDKYEVAFMGFEKLEA